VQHRFLLSVERARAFYNQIGADQSARLFVNCLGKAAAERAERNERRNSERDGNGKKEQSRQAIFGIKAKPRIK
jgi:hypothetical protein